MHKKSRTMRLICAVLLLLSVLIPQIILAQEYPNKPVILVIPMPPGGTHDLTARAVTSVAADYLGQPMLIKLMPGGGGAIGNYLPLRVGPGGRSILSRYAVSTITLKSWLPIPRCLSKPLKR
jgi:tripartite-type tricarboxylate transporter receptor subunit TctC